MVPASRASQAFGDGSLDNNGIIVITVAMYVYFSYVRMYVYILAMYVCMYLCMYVCTVIDVGNKEISCSG